MLSVFQTVKEHFFFQVSTSFALNNYQTAIYLIIHRKKMTSHPPKLSEAFFHTPVFFFFFASKRLTEHSR